MKFFIKLEEQLESDRMRQVRMDCESRVPRYWPKSCRGGRNAPRGCVPADPNHNKLLQSPRYQSPSTKKVAYCFHFIISPKQFGDLPNSLTYNREIHQRDVILTSRVIISFRNLTPKP
ncbi:hypothetical protein TNCV_1666541 [Trichonephila clavipes]|nr:hypothetical protein TNCV_1666541 [Trichonephila clavipes]